MGHVFVFYPSESLCSLKIVPDNFFELGVLESNPRYSIHKKTHLEGGSFYGWRAQRDSKYIK